MTTDTEALRAQFEAWATAAYRLSFDDDTPLKRYLWTAYQAGHAAAMAETAAAVAQERERIADLAADLAADACVEYANGRPMDFRTMVGDAIRAGAKERNE